MKEQIFISYKRVDKERVFAIKDFIEQTTGAKCWIDLDGIESDAQFASIIISAIREAEIFLFMYSKTHGNINLDNDWTIRELNFAEKRGKRIVFINIDQSPLTDWFELMFGTKQQIDATNSDMLNRLCDDLCSWLGILKPAAEPDSESQKKAKRDALPKGPFRVGNLMYKASEHDGVGVCGCDESLEEVHIPAKVEYSGYTYDVDSIGDRAFEGCESLTTLSIPESVTSIGEYAFNNCSSLTSITIPNSVTCIGNSAFACCESLTSITIPDSVTKIGETAFYGCKSLTSIIVGKGNEKYDSRENCNAIIETATNTLISGCKNTIIPDTITGIGNSAFCGCESLTSITIPNSVISIGPYAFSVCKSLTSILIPDSVTNIGDSAFMWCESLTSISIPNSVTSIGDKAFKWCFGLTSITIPNSVTKIGETAFYGCKSLTSIIVEKGNKKYDSRENCNAIIETATNTLISGCKNTIIPDTITSIGRDAFCGCFGLTSITIPNSVTCIGDSAFTCCEGLTSITIPDSVTSIDRFAFNECSSLTTITIPNSVTSIGGYAFFRCESLTTITISNSVTSIGDCAFFGCESLTSITIPDSVISIGESAFGECNSLKEISISKKLTSIGRDAIPEHTRVSERGNWSFLLPHNR